MASLAQRIDALPVEAKQKVLHLVEDLEKAEMIHATNRRKLSLSWAGSLAHLRGQYTSVELQHKALDWRTERT